MPASPSSSTPDLLHDAPDAVRAYFTLTRAAAHGAASVAFTDTAQVADDGQTYIGRDAIRAWLTRTPSEFTYTVTPTHLVVEGATVTVTSHVAGTFPGGSVDLRYAFNLAPDGRISELQITNAAA